MRLGCCWQRAFRHQRPPRHRPGRGGLGDAESSASFSRYRVCSSQTSRHQSQNRACSRRTTPRRQAPTRRGKRTRTLSAAATPARHTRRADTSPSPSPQGRTPISSSTRRISKAGSINQPNTNCLKTSSPPLAVSNPSHSNPTDKAFHKCSARDRRIGNARPHDHPSPKSTSSRPAAIMRCRATAFSTSTSSNVCADPMRPINRDPRDETTPPEPPSPPTRSSPSSH